MFRLRNEMSLLDPLLLLDRRIAVLSLWKNDTTLAIFMEIIDENNRYIIKSLELNDFLKERKDGKGFSILGYILNSEPGSDERRKINFAIKDIEADGLTTADVKPLLDKFTHSQSLNISMEQSSTIFKGLRELQGKYIEPGESINIIQELITRIHPLFHPNMVKLKSNPNHGCVLM